MIGGLMVVVDLSGGTLTFDCSNGTFINALELIEGALIVTGLLIRIVGVIIEVLEVIVGA